MKMSTKILRCELIALINIVPEINTENNMTINIIKGMLIFLTPALLLQIALFICVKKLEKLDLNWRN